MGTQLYLPTGWARQLGSRLDPIERLPELERDRIQAKGDIREILDGLADKRGATVRDVTVAMRSIDDTLSDLLYDQERMLQHRNRGSVACLTWVPRPVSRLVWRRLLHLRLLRHLNCRVGRLFGSQHPYGPKRSVQRLACTYPLPRNYTSRAPRSLWPRQDS